MSYAGIAGELTARYTPVASQDAAGDLDVVASGSVTGGAYGLFRYDLAPGAGPAAHFHRTFSESFYVLDGQIRLYDGERWLIGKVGDFLFVPAGGTHAFNNGSNTHSSLLILFAPGIPRERYFIELAAIMKSGRRLSAAEWTEFYARHDQFMV